MQCREWSRHSGGLDAQVGWWVGGGRHARLALRESTTPALEWSWGAQAARGEASYRLRARVRPLPVISALLATSINRLAPRRRLTAFRAALAPFPLPLALLFALYAEPARTRRAKVSLPPATALPAWQAHTAWFRVPHRMRRAPLAAPAHISSPLLRRRAPSAKLAPSRPAWAWSVSRPIIGKPVHYILYCIPPHILPLASLYCR